MLFAFKSVTHMDKTPNDPSSLIYRVETSVFALKRSARELIL